MTSGRKTLVWGKEQVIEHAEKLLAAAKAGELDDVVMAHRLFKSDGSFEDIAFGGTEEQRAALLEKLRATDD
ncbi:hypothetical protein [Variovorax sp. LjRoot178]|uniref:hypothetical protein n=1 Tax=Variovorax sp. LjRoot178 TaxID=3342277 RepID=UPI003ECD32B1